MSWVGRLVEDLVFVVPVILAVASVLGVLAGVNGRFRRGAWRATPPPPSCPRCGGTGRVTTAAGEQWPCVDNSYHDRIA